MSKPDKDGIRRIESLSEITDSIQEVITEFESQYILPFDPARAEEETGTATP